MKNKLSNNGYIIIKNEYDLKMIREIKEELTVKPYTMNDFNVGYEKKFSILCCLFPFTISMFSVFRADKNLI